MSRYLTNRDPGDETQAALFDPADTMPRQCPHCHAVRRHDDARAAGCHHDLEIDAGAPRARRPRACLNAWDPSTHPLPDGY